MKKKRIALISTGGTIEKTYNSFSGLLENKVSVLDVMLASLELEGVALTRVALMNKDSLDMSDAEHRLIASEAFRFADNHDGVVVVHGTDRLSESGDAAHALGTPNSPIVLTGAMRPYVMRNTDATQNLAEALLSVQLLDPGVYAVMHNRVHRFPGVFKDKEKGTFVSNFPPEA